MEDLICLLATVRTLKPHPRLTLFIMYDVYKKRVKTLIVWDLSAIIIFDLCDKQSLITIHGVIVFINDSFDKTRIVWDFNCYNNCL